MCSYFYVQLVFTSSLIRHNMKQEHEVNYPKKKERSQHTRSGRGGEENIKLKNCAARCLKLHEKAICTHSLELGWVASAGEIVFSLLFMSNN
jgi:hypothetical protein